jgi:DNA repair protein RadA/Sms
MPARTSSGAGRGSSSLLYGDGSATVLSAREVAAAGAGKAARFSTGMFELDRVFGGGVVLGSVTLLGGEPGIGKSTILTQMLLKMISEKQKFTALYVAGEESPQQIWQRIERTRGSLEGTGDWQDAMHFLSTPSVDLVIAEAERLQPSVLVVDSIQTLMTEDLTGMVGSVGQLREVTARLVGLAKRSSMAIILVGHVTKEGDIAGPKVLEHIVDTVLHISGERTDEIRTIRSLKNRFGPTDEVGLFRLTEQGAQEVTNPAEVFLEAENQGKPGSALALCLEGSRPVVVEVQALVVDSSLPTPRRVSRGINVSKLHLLLAVLHKHAKTSFAEQDVYVNVVGNIEFRDPAIDLAVAAAVLSAKTGKPFPKHMVFSGEVGLLGEVRRVVSFDKRAKEATRQGYNPVVGSEMVRSVSQLRGLTE